MVFVNIIKNISKKDKDNDKKKKSSKDKLELLNEKVKINFEEDK